MGNIEISSVKSDELKKLMLQADKKFSNDEKTSGNGNEKIDTVFEESVLRAKIRTGLANGSIQQNDELDNIMESIGLKLTKEEKKSKPKVSDATLETYKKYYYDKNNKKTYHNHDEAFKAAEKDLKAAGVSRKERKALEKEVDEKAAYIVYAEWAANEDNIDKKNMKKAAEKSLKEKGLWNDKTKDVLNGGVSFGQWIQGKQSNEKHLRDDLSRRNLVRQLKERNWTKDEIVNGFTYKNEKTGEEHKVKGIGEEQFKVLTKPYEIKNDEGKVVQRAMITLNDDKKTYNIKNLSEDTFKFTGTDYILDVQKNYYKPYSERKQLNDYMNRTGDIHQTNKETLKSTRLAGFKTEKSSVFNPIKGVAGAVVGFVTGAAAGGTAAATNPKSGVNETITKKGDTLDMNVDLQVDNGSFDIKNAAALEKLGATVTTVGTSIHIFIQGKDKVLPFLYEAPKYISQTALKVGAMMGALGALSGLEQNGEKPVFIHELDCEEINKQPTNDAKWKNFEKQVMQGATNKQTAKAILKLGEGFFVKDKDGNVTFDCDGLNDLLKEMRGNQSVLNIRELMVGLAERLIKEGKPVPPEIVEMLSFTGETKCTDAKTETEKVDIPRVERNEDWGVFASRYQCLEEVDSNFAKKEYDQKLKKLVPGKYARTMMKVMQAINDGNYDIARLQRLTMLAMAPTYKQTLPNESGFDYQTYKDLRDGAIVKQKLPTITKDGVDICNPGESAYKNTFKGVKGGKSAQVQDDTRLNVTDATFEGRLKDNKGNTYWTNSEKAFNEKVAEWSKTKENKGITKTGCTK